MKNLFTIIIVILAVQISFSQEADSLIVDQPDSLYLVKNYDEKGTIVDMVPLENKDTLKITRWYGDWWFGGGVNLPYNEFLGEFYASARYENPVSDSFNPEFLFTNGTGFGYGIGLTAEYNPISSRHGGFLNLNYTSRSFEMETGIINPIDERRYLINSTINYFEIRPAYRYDITPNGFYTYIGPGIDIPISQDSRHLKQFVNSGDINEFGKFDLDDLKMRFYIHFGLGYDLLLVDLNGTRFRLSPFFAADFGTSVIGEQNQGVKESDISLASARVGITLKFGNDKRKTDTLKFDPNYVGPDYDIAGIENEVNLSRNLKDSPIKTSTDIAYYEKSEPVVVEEPIAEIEEDDRFGMETSRLKFFDFPTPAATDITPSLKKYLNSVIKFMKENPGTEVRVVGHSDNMGTPEQNQRRSVVRKDKVVRYLLSKGIDRYRILDRGEGDRRPIADSRTAEGRKKNRRVEITILQ